MSPQPVPRARRRQFYIITLLLVLLLGGYGLYRAQFHRLRPVVDRALPAETELGFRYGFGYPAVEQRYLGGEDHQVTWLDELCRPTGRSIHTYEVTANSPGFTVFADTPDRQVVMRWRNGKQTAFPSNLHDDGRLSIISELTDAGVIADYDGYYFFPDGRPVTLPKDGRRYEPGQVSSLDPQTLVLFSRDVKKPGSQLIHLFDLHTGHLVFTGQPWFAGSAVLLRQGDRYLIQPDDYWPGLIEHGKLTVRCNIFRWSEDGTVWREVNGGFDILLWRTDKLSSTRRMPLAQPRRGEQTSIEPLSIRPDGSLHTLPAVWGDGVTIAYTDTVPTLPESVATSLRKLPLSPRTAWAHRNLQRLVLQHHGRVVGVCTVPLPPPKLVYFPTNGYQIDTSEPPQEHLAFSPDGRYLSWALNTGKGWHIRVFRVPKVK